MDLNWIRSLIELMRESDIDTVEVSRFGSRVRISKSPPVQMAAAELPAMQALQPAAAPAAPVPTVGAAPEVGTPSNLHEVTSPMVGTFYRSPAPDAPSYVEVGDEIGKGQTLCILEAMKLMNELESEVAGTIREICVENAEPVEYGQLLFRIEPSAG
ncbi:MAG: acetyl-CoA carboxylase biotin carboxyl carrier protein [Acidobacteriota bacterium]|nr:acetyl-CoA carboxylase biotin carboxyl carrier protein [Acidobacteriota bacterium]